MHIKIVKKHSESYCELVVTDNYKNIVCICDFISNEETEVPSSGTKISMINAFFLDENPKITIINDEKKQKFKLSKNGLFGMSYSLRGKIVDAKKYILKVYDFYVSLEYLFSSEYLNPLKFVYKDGDWIELIVDRFDAII